jgi:hypothetical protein
MGTHALGFDYTAGWHSYDIVRASNSITILVDGVQVFLSFAFPWVLFCYFIANPLFQLTQAVLGATGFPDMPTTPMTITAWVRSYKKYQIERLTLFPLFFLLYF